MDKVNKQELRRLAERGVQNFKYLQAANPSAILSLLDELEQVEKSGWRNHSVNFARAEKCPQTLEAAQAAWDRDQELIEEQRQQIAKDSQTINDLRQKLEQYRKDALRYRFIADNAADVIMSASATDCGDGDTTFGPRAEIDLCQYPVEMFGSAKIKLDFAVDAAMAKEGGANG